MRRNDGFTLIELLIVISIIALLAAIAVPGLLRSRLAANEASAISSLRTISSAEVTYASTCGRGGYAQSLADLNRANPIGTEFIGPDLGQDPSTKSGYEMMLAAETGAATIALAASTCNGSVNDSVSAFWAGARPIQAGLTGQRAFVVDRRGTLFQSSNGAAHIANPIPAAATPLQ
jgi:prepilin-type N-terminal cleavage/methylation domain-containing protein